MIFEEKENWIIFRNSFESNDYKSVKKILSPTPVLVLVVTEGLRSNAAFITGVSFATDSE
jgi:hypothetical protein